MSTIHVLSRRIFRATKRPIWQAVHALSGVRLQAAAEYFDFGIYGGFFEAEASELGERLPPGFEVVESRPGIAELELWCGQYRHIDLLAPYNELAVIAPVRLLEPGRPGREGGFVLHMPVTSEEARWAGVDAYGFPKILAEIQITDAAGGKLCVVRHRGVHVLTLHVAEQPGAPFERSSTLLNVRDDGRIIEAPFEMDGLGSTAATPGGVSLELGHHAIAEDLRGIGLRADTGRAIDLPQVHGLLSKGVDLGPLSPQGPGIARRVDHLGDAEPPTTVNH